VFEQGKGPVFKEDSLISFNLARAFCQALFMYSSSSGVTFMSTFISVAPRIELADQPFVPRQDPADFGADLKSAKNVIILNGTIGRSAHHGILGNGNSNVIIMNVDFVDFEVAAVALNGVKGLRIQNSAATNRKDVPVIGTFSSSQFIKPYVEFLVRTDSPTVLHVGGTNLSATDIRDALRDSINNVHEDLIIGGRSSIDKLTHPQATLDGYGGAAARGYTIAGSSQRINSILLCYIPFGNAGGL
jgi:hypothetical protein